VCWYARRVWCRERRAIRIKTDKRDAELLMRCLMAGQLSQVRVPSVEEGLRELVRARERSKPTCHRCPSDWTTSVSSRRVVILARSIGAALGVAVFAAWLSSELASLGPTEASADSSSRSHRQLARIASSRMPCRPCSRARAAASGTVLDRSAET
jgi:hypothetical protein